MVKMIAYQTLQIPTTATQDDIKRAFRVMAHKHHPDKGGNTEKFKEINQAYQEINTKEKQERYNLRYISQPVNSYNTFTYRESAQKAMMRDILKHKFAQQKPEYYYDGTRWVYGINHKKR